MNKKERKERKEQIKKARKLAKPFRVTEESFRLKDIDPGDTLDFTSEDKPLAKLTSSEVLGTDCIWVTSTTKRCHCR